MHLHHLADIEAFSRKAVPYRQCCRNPDRAGGLPGTPPFASEMKVI